MSRSDSLGCVTLRANLYGMKRVHTTIYRYSVELKPPHHEWHQEIVRKFLAINRPVLKKCYISPDHLFLYSSKPILKIVLHSMVDHEDKSFMVKLNFIPLTDVFKWQQKEAFNIIIYFWKKKYRIFGDMFYDPKRKMSVLERGKLWVVPGFQFTFQDAPANQMLSIVSRVYCCDENLFWVNPYTLTSDNYEEFTGQGYHFSRSFFLNIEEPMKQVCPYLTEFGIHPEQVTLSGRVVEPPPLLPSDPQVAYYKVPQDSVVWALLAFDPHFTDEELEHFRLSLTELATQRGLDLDQCVVCRSFTPESLDQIEALFSKLKEMNIQLVLVGFPRYSNYNSTFLSIKNFSTNYNLTTQFFTTADKELYFDLKGGIKMFEMLLIKINRKFFGKVNTIEPYYFERFAFEFDKMMLIGSTVNDPKQEGFSSKQYFAVLIASMDFEFETFSTVARLNETSLSIITELKQMFLELLQRYHSHNGYYPQSVLYFRHDYHADNCYRREISLMEEVMTSLMVPCRIAYVTATKVTKLRFNLDTKETPLSTSFLIDAHLESDVLPNSFYIHQQHHLRPTRYSIIQNKILSTDQLRQICFDLCHFYLHKLQPLCHPIVLELTLLQAIKIRRALDDQLVLSQIPVLSDDVVKKFLGEFP